jgi:hypothetical protein
MARGTMIQARELKQHDVFEVEYHNYRVRSTHVIDVTFENQVLEGVLIITVGGTKIHFGTDELVRKVDESTFTPLPFD